MKTFCIAGPIIPEDHYYIPRRLSWELLDQFLANKYYFLIHAPRQSGKTTTILEYVKHLNETDKYTALYLTTEPAHIARNAIERTVYWLLVQLARQIRIQLPSEQVAYIFAQELLKQNPIPEDSFYQFLEFWSENSPKPLAIFLDEVDGLVENSLIFLLKQLRTGYTNRPTHFPQSVCLIGVRNLQDYKLQSIEEQEKGILLSPFNIVADSLLLRNFTEKQVRDLYMQHTQETGQVFTEEAICYAYYLTQGQPWLVNALAYQACFRDILDRSIPITKDSMEKAKEQLILRMDTHISALVDKLNEPRVRNIIDAIISGSDPLSFNPDDIQYVRDLGLVKENSWEIANPIYQQVIPRALTYVIQELIPHQTSWYVESDGKLNMDKLLTAFTQFFRENAEAYSTKLDYKESFPHLLLMAFLQRVINGGGQINREYAVGTKRVDLLIVWNDKYRYVLELKIKYSEDTLGKGLDHQLANGELAAGTADYIDLCNAHEAHLLLFDRDPTKKWEEKISNEIVTFKNKQIHVWTL
jgi:hypothetical protein